MSKILQKKMVNVKDVVQFRSKTRKMIFLDFKTNTTTEVDYDDRIILYLNIPLISKQLQNIGILNPLHYKRVTILNKENLLLNLDLPEPCDFFISRNETFKLDSVSTNEEISDNLFVYAVVSKPFQHPFSIQKIIFFDTNKSQVPTFEGEIYKQVGTLVKGWKKM